VLGAGAQGAGVAADMAAAGLDVTVIEQWPAHVEAMREHGIRVHHPGGEAVTPVRAIHLCEVAELRQPFDVVFLVVKAYDTRWAAELIAPHVAADGVVVGLQNGMSIDEIVAAVGAERTVGAVIEMASSMFDPGVVTKQNGPDTAWFAIGAEHPAAAARLADVQSALARTGTVEIVDDIRSAKWMKLVANAGELVVSAILDLPLAEAARIDGVHDFMVGCGTEAARAAIADGSRLVPILGLGDLALAGPEAYASALLGEVLDVYTMPDTLTTVLQDWMKHRHCEYREINGLVVDVLERAGQPAPFSRRVVELAARIESGELRRGIENLDRLLAAV